MSQLSWPGNPNATGIILKMRHSGRVKTRAIHVALGIDIEGDKELLGLWIGEIEGAKF